MKLNRTRMRRAIGTFTLIAAVAFAAGLSAPEVCAQPAPSSDQLNQLMQHRQEMSKRAVDETRQRRFEEGQSESTFPSDIANARKGGVVRALTPEQQKALKHNERGLQLFSKGKQDDAIKEYQEAIRSDPTLAAAHNNLSSTYFRTCPQILTGLPRRALPRRSCARLSGRTRRGPRPRHSPPAT